MVCEVKDAPSDLSIEKYAEYFASSGYFPDAKTPAQALVKIQAGRELGFSPVASMVGVQIIGGKVGLSSNMMAATVKRSTKYDYRVKQLTDKGCTLTFTLKDGGELLGDSTFTMEDAKTAKLAFGNNWKEHPRNMLFARALSNGVKWHCPDAVHGTVYDEDEFDGRHIEQPQAAAPPAEKPADTQPHETKPQESKPALDQAMDEMAKDLEQPHGTDEGAPLGEKPGPQGPAGEPLFKGPDLTKLKALIEKHSISTEVQAGFLRHFHVEKFEQMHQDDVNATIARIERKIKTGV